MELRSIEMDRKGLKRMSKKAIDSEYLVNVWGRINSVIAEQGTNKKAVAERCGFDRKSLYHYGNLTLTYFARLCEELNVSADFFLFGLDKKKEKTNVAAYQPDMCYEDMQKPREIIKEAKKMMQCKDDDTSICEEGVGNRKKRGSLNKKKAEYKKEIIAVNNRCGISAQKELMTLADDFCLLGREDIRKIIETCRNYDEGQQGIMRIYKELYL